MKKKMIFTALFSLLMQLLIMYSTAAQTPGITLNGTFDSMSVHCSAPSDVQLCLTGYAIGYQPTDSVEVFVNFGDGTDTTFYHSLINSYQGWLWIGVYHTYYSPGSFSLEYIVTGPDGSTDTLIAYNEVVVSNSCGAISGQVYFDVNGNCVYDAGDYPVSCVSILILGGPLNTDYWVYTDSAGMYSMNVPDGYTYTVSFNPNNMNSSAYTVSCPSSGEYSVSVLPSQNNDFGLTCQPGYDITGFMYSWGAVPGFDTYTGFVFWNERCTPVSGQVKLILDPELTYVDAYPNPPDNIIGDTLIWNFSNVGITGTGNYLEYDVDAYLSPSAVIGDTLCNLLIIEPVSGDEVPSNNIIYDCNIIVGSYDPNMKEVYPVGEGPTGLVPMNSEMTYTVYFQNTGTAPAHDVYILDTLDSDLDVSTLKIIGSSHPMQFSMVGSDVMKFAFNNIMLPDSTTDEQGSHGFVRYSISQKQNLPDMTEILNTADIYFDFNPAVATNQTLNTVSIIEGLYDEYNTESLSIYPVPADKILSLNIHSSVDHALLQIVNQEGRIIYKQNVNGGILGINVEKFKPGVYTVLLSSDKKYYSCKAMVIH